ncbi:MAG: 2-hydroxy-3-oxopropionate reductase [Natronomonas sp.]|jgi:2-hydroxy-3-oxopropionate reductase|uniref:NAD(P)-dependent oxidoreductase n=1 Tax=Natronomonas sp. TaxID=2184060 RepID=UPI003989E43A
MSSKPIGFIGLGIMGAPMAKNLLEAGFKLIGYNRSPEPLETFIGHGGKRAESPQAVAERADVVITCLSDTDAVREVVQGSDGVLNGIGEDTTYIDMSTISPTATEDLAEAVTDAGGNMLDAPISGGEQGAIEGSLSIMIGGDPEELDAQRDVLNVLGDRITHCGPSGAGQTTKACNQILVAAQATAVSEALVFAQRAGADLEAVIEAISGGAASCWTLENRASRMIEGNFDPGFFASYQYKDLRIASDAGEAFGAPMPQTSVTHELYKAMENTGRGSDDSSGVIQVLEDLAGEQARKD